MKFPKLSFLIAAHNEEKIIGKTLKNLLNLPYENYEVILGLDGCTDNTESIAKEFCKKSKKFKYYKLNLRQGKPEVINSIIKHASGEIAIINDADWLFTVKDRKTLERYLAVFNNPKVGGIAESFPVEWQEEKLRTCNAGYKMVAYSTHLWLDFQKKNFTLKEKGIDYLKEPTMFLTNVFRRKLYKKNFSLGDDFERTKHIMSEGYKIVIFDDIEMPRMIATYDKIGLKDVFKQKIRTALARKQLEDIQKINTNNYYLPAVLHIFKNSWKLGLSAGFLIIFWIFLTTIATLIAGFKNTDTREGWKLRAKR